MSARLAFFSALAAVVVLAGCDTGPATLDAETDLALADTAYALLLADVGGTEGLGALLQTASNEELRATFARYGMAFEVVDRTLSEGSETAARGQDIRTCPQLFPTTDRTKWFRVVGAGGAEDHYIDSRGRPATAYKLTPSQFHADVKIGGVWKSADFTNASSGGPNGTSQATSMVSWLQSKGCY